MNNVVLSTRHIDDLISDIADEVIKKLNHYGVLTGNIPEPPIKGIHELAKFLRVSPARAQKLKNEGVVPYFQDGRTLLFYPAEVRKAMQEAGK